VSDPSETDQAQVSNGEGDPAEGDVDDVDATPETDETELARVERERDEMRALAQQIQADFENFRKQAIRRETAVIERASERLVTDILPVLDSFELAVAQLSDDTDPLVRKGVELVYAELVGVLEKAGLERIDSNGQPFDPNEHEAVLQEAGDGDPVVVDTMRTGYRLKGRVVRPAMVKVAS
jgi:molecular chaperone GrpE